MVFTRGMARDVLDGERTVARRAATADAPVERIALYGWRADFDS